MNSNNKGYEFVFMFMFMLCFMQCHGTPQAAVNKSSRSTKRVVVLLKSILLGSTTGLGCALVCALLIRCIFIYIINRVPILKGPVVFSPLISPKSLQSALSNPSQSVHLGGGGSSSSSNNNNNNGQGMYYKTTLLDNGFTVAVKKLPPFDENNNKTRRRRRRMQRDLEILAGLKHRHLLTLRAYLYHDDDDDDDDDTTSARFCLVYDYVPTGSLEDAMRRDNGLRMGWDARLRIAVGIIKALHYLHFTSLCHFNLKPSNVLLDPDFEPRLTDSGFPPSSIFHHYYYAPECFPNFSMYTEKSDIFSFGVILGILLTGRDPSDPLFGQATSGSRGDMGMWFRQLVEAGDAREALDKSLLGQEMEEDEMLMAVRIAAVCLSDMPADRPSSDELVPMLTQLHSF